MLRKQCKIGETVRGGVTGENITGFAERDIIGNIDASKII
jgi:hypothetical protein